MTDARDARRPSLEDVVSVMDQAFSSMSISVRRLTAGPPTWIWEDLEMAKAGFSRYYIISTSNTEGLEGFPIFTVRQSYSRRFDTWTTLSALVLGTDAGSIARSISLTITHHAGGFSGIKHTAATIVENGGSVMAGMVAAQGLMNMPPVHVSADQIESLVDEALEETKERVVN